MLDSSSSLSSRFDVAHDPALDVFDVARAAHPTRVLACDAVVDMLHVTNLPDTVHAYRAAMQRGERFPPVSVVRLCGVWFIADGHKRFSAYRGLGARQIVVEVWPLRRWLRDQGEQGRATWRRWRAVLGRHDGAPALRAAVAAELAHLWRMLASLVQPRSRHGELPMASVSSRLLAAALQHRGLLTLTAIGFLLLSISQLCLTWLLKLWIDGPLAQASATGPGWLLPATVSLVGVLSSAVFAAHLGLGSLHAAVIRDLRGGLQEHLLRLRIGALESSAVGDLVARLLQDADVAGRFAGEMVRRGLGDALVFVGALTMLLIIDRQLFALILLIAPLGVVGHSLVARMIRKRSLATQQRLGALAARFGEQVSGQRTIRGYRTEAAEQRRFAAENQAHADALLSVERWSAWSLASIWLVTGLALLGVGVYAGQALAAGRLAAGDFLIFCLFGAQMVEPIRRLGELSTLAQRSLAAAQRVYEVLDRDEVERRDGEPLPQPVTGCIDFDAVGFGYSPAQPVLRELTLRIAARETLAIVSPSGVGKSTIAALLVRFFEPDSGVIRLDGRPLGNLRVDDVRAAIKVVTQEPFLFAGSVLDNLRYGTKEAPAALVDAAAQQAGLDAWLRGLPHGLQTSIEEAGRNLSGGQKQRISLARAIVAQPAVLVLDEATSAIDSDTEEQILANLDAWLRQRTVVLMAHRLSTVLRVPRALVLEDGRIVEDGAPRELLRRSSHFARMFGDQLGAGVNDPWRQA